MWPTWRRFVASPTIFWLSCADWLLVAVPLVGALAGLTAALGVNVAATAWSTTTFLGLAWLSALSVDKVVSMLFPWDCLLLESGFLALFLPHLNDTTELLQQLGTAVWQGDGWPSAHAWISALSAAEAPSALLNTLFRWLLFRLMFGFGKLKFTGTTRQDSLYVKYFYINMPMASPIGYLCTYELGMSISCANIQACGTTKGCRHRFD